MTVGGCHRAELNYHAQRTIRTRSGADAGNDSGRSRQAHASCDTGVLQVNDDAIGGAEREEFRGDDIPQVERDAGAGRVGAYLNLTQLRRSRGVNRDSESQCPPEKNLLYHGLRGLT